MHRILAGFIHILLWILFIPPLKVLYLGSRIVYILLYHIFSYRKNIINDNIRASFPELEESDVRIMIKKYYRHLSQVSVEALKAMHWPLKKMTKRASLINKEILEGLAESGRDIVVLAGHTGNWEWLPALVAPYGFELLGVYKPQTSRVVDILSVMIRKKEGVKPIPMRETARAMKSPSDKGKPKALLLIADQIPAKPDIHFWYSFMNRETGWFLGGEKIARKYDLPVIYLNMSKKKPGFYEGKVELITMNPGLEEEGQITKKYIRLLEENIKKQPEFWLWSHRRWKHQH